MNSKIGVLLLNLGGPEKTEDIRPFLYNLFSDRQIIRLGPFFLQKPLAALIAKRRAPKSAENYKKIGGGSPLRKITEEQARKLEQSLNKDGDFVVQVAMRYWHPFTIKAVEKLIAEKVDEIIALPLYPHYSIATTGSSFTDLDKIIRKRAPKLTIKKIISWPVQPEYIQSIVKKIQKGLRTYGNEPVQILYSAHSLPVKFIEEGDPYVDHIQLTIKEIEKTTGVTGTLCYQSRSGPVEWLGPSTPETLELAAEKECKNVMVVPISFISDHVETLYELNIEYRQMAEQLGLNYAVTEGLNTCPLFIEGLRQLTLNA